MDLDSLYGKKGQITDSTTRKLIFPPSKTGKLELLSEIRSSNKPVNIPVEIEQYYQIYTLNGNNCTSSSSSTNSTNSTNSNLKNQSNEVTLALNNSNQNKTNLINNDDSRLSGNMYILPVSYLRINRHLIQPNLRILFTGICLTPPEPEGFDKTDKHIDLLMNSINKNQKLYDKHVTNYENHINNCYYQFLEYIAKDQLDPTIIPGESKQTDLISSLTINMIKSHTNRSNSNNFLHRNNKSTEISSRNNNANNNANNNNENITVESLVNSQSTNDIRKHQNTQSNTTNNTYGYLLPRNKQLDTNTANNINNNTRNNKNMNPQFQVSKTSRERKAPMR